MKMYYRLILCTTASILVIPAIGGCRDTSGTPKIHSLKGRVTKIDAGSGIVTGLFRSKQNSEMELSGKLAPDAEIIIDGRTATLEEVQIGDDVEVEGLEEKQGGQSVLIALKVRITRALGTTQPADTRPAEPGATP